MGARNNESEIPLLLTFFYLFHESEVGHYHFFWTQGRLQSVNSGRRHCQVGSLSGAAHMLKDNISVLR